MSGSHIGAGGKGRKETRLEQVFCTLRLPGKGSGGEEGWGRKRRVDLIFACQYSSSSNACEEVSLMASYYLY
jgi:hypothetical protein